MFCTLQIFHAAVEGIGSFEDTLKPGLYPFCATLCNRSNATAKWSHRLSHVSLTGPFALTFFIGWLPIPWSLHGLNTPASHGLPALSTP